MPLYPLSIRRCQHIKVNGTQCGSPALREEKYCHFHMQWFQKSMDINLNCNQLGAITLPTLEDANSIQAGLAEVMRLLVTNQIDHRTAALLLHALRTASVNIRHASFEPEPTRVVIDRECVERRPIGATAWSTVEGREYDQVENNDVENDDMENDELGDEGGEVGADVKRLIDLVVVDPRYLEWRAAELRAKQSKELVER